MMKNEYNIIKKVDHPCIVKIHEIYQEQEYVVFVMDFLTGGEIY